MGRRTGSGPGTSSAPVPTGSQPDRASNRPCVDHRLEERKTLEVPPTGEGREVPLVVPRTYHRPLTEPHTDKQRWGGDPEPDSNLKPSISVTRHTRTSTHALTVAVTDPGPTRPDPNPNNSETGDDRTGVNDSQATRGPRHFGLGPPSPTVS